MWNSCSTNNSLLLPFKDLGRCEARAVRQVGLLRVSGDKVRTRTVVVTKRENRDSAGLFYITLDNRSSGKQEPNLKPGQEKVAKVRKC